MIFVTLGTQKFQMNRLVEAVDKIASMLKEDVFIQTGSSTFKPVNCEYKDFLDAAEFNEHVSNCTVLITHAGVGSIMTGINAKKPVIVVPRLAHFHEHVDDHQTEIAEAFASKKCVIYCKDLQKLSAYIDKCKTFKFEPYVVRGGKIEDIVLNFLKIFE